MDKRAILFILLSLTCFVKGNDGDIEGIDVVASQRNGIAGFKMDFAVFDRLETCKLKLSNGTVYELHPNSNLTDTNIEADLGILKSECGFKIFNVTLNYIGHYDLIASVEGFMKNETIVKSLNVVVKEKINMVPVATMLVYTGQDIEFYLSEMPEGLHTCKITALKKKNESELYSKSNNCLVNIKNVTKDVSGIWNISAIGDIELFSDLNITVKDFPQIDPRIDIALGVQTTLTLGPLETIFCRATNPSGEIVAENVGQCIVDINRVTQNDGGIWTVDVGLEGSISSVKYEYEVHVNDLGVQNEGEILTHSEYAENGDYAQIECTLLVKSMKSCLIARADGRVFILNEGIGMDRYKYFTNKTNKLQNSVDYVSCGIHITNLTSIDWKPWKCIIIHGDDSETSSIVNVKRASNSTQVPGDESIYTVNSTVNAAKDSPFEIMCNYLSPISYCWFKSPNGSIISILPGSVHEKYEYVGSGLKMGQCGLRIKSATKADTGIWKCNIGTDFTEDINIRIKVNVHETPLVAAKKNYILNAGESISCKTFDRSSLEYCRFIRPDGKGINPNNASDRYSDIGTNLEDGQCNLTLSSLSDLDIGTWFCIGKPHFKDVEYFDTIYVDFYYSYFYHVSTFYLIFWFFFAIAMSFVIIVFLITVFRIFSQRYQDRRTPASRAAPIAHPPSSYNLTLEQEDIKKVSFA